MTITADHVARAVVEASRFTGADPITVVGQVEMLNFPRDEYRRISRARTLAALALTRNFPRVPKQSLARMVGVSYGSRSSYLSLLERDLRRGGITWLPRDQITRVAKAIGAPEAASDPVKEAPKPPPKAPVRTADPERRALVERRFMPAKHVIAQPAPPAPAAATVVRSGIAVDAEHRTISTAAGKIELDQDETAALATLARVSPSILDYDRIAVKIWSHTSDGRYRLSGLFDRLNPRLAAVGLVVRHVQKIGYTLQNL